MPARKASQRSAKVDEEPVVRTRYGRGIKSTPTKGETTIPTTTAMTSPTRSRKVIQTMSNESHVSRDDHGAYAIWQSPKLIIQGLPSKFLHDLWEREKREQKKKRLYTGQFTQSDLDETSPDESDLPTPPPAGPVRGRGRGRGGRARGRGVGRGRGRGSAAAAAAAALLHHVSHDQAPVRTRKPRTAAPAFPLLDQDGDDSTNQNSPAPDAKNSAPTDEHVNMADAFEGDSLVDRNGPQDSFTDADTRPASPSAGADDAVPDASQHLMPPLSHAVSRKSGTQTPLNGASTGVATPVLELLDPEDDVLSDSDLPGPWVEDYRPPATEAECDDRADFLLKTRFKPMTDVQDLIASLTKFAPAQRSTENLYLLAENTQRILREWQDEYLELDAKTAPHAHPPKKPANGGRVPMDPLVFEAMKEADLYGYNYDPRKAPLAQDPFTQRPGSEKARGRELRQRRNRDLLDSAAPSEAEGEDGERGPGRRQRRATKRFESGEPNGTVSPKKSGWGGARKRGVSRFAKEASETPEPDGRLAKRVKTGPTNLVHPRIQEVREESVVPSSGEEGSTIQGTPEPMETPKAAEERKRGRPAGSKNTGRRSDFGIKKGPRKKPLDSETLVSVAPLSSAPPPVLQSLSEGQNQFSIDPQPLPPPPAPQPLAPAPVPITAPPPPAVPQPMATIFQATPQPPPPPEQRSHPPPPIDHNPDVYMNTAGLSQYSQQTIPQPTALTPQSITLKPKPRVKSEKRSQSMTIWWAERKARAKEAEASTTPANPNEAPLDAPKDESPADSPGAPRKPTSKNSTPKPQNERKRIGRPPLGKAELPAVPPRLEPALPHGHIYPNPIPHAHAPNINPQHPHARPHMEYIPSHSHNIPHALPPPSHILMQHSPLTALPSGAMGLPSNHAPPSNLAPRPNMPVLAPAPMPPQLPSYPSPYGPRGAARPRSRSSTVQPLLAPLAPLAPAPPQGLPGQQQQAQGHVSPYGPPPVPPPTLPPPPPQQQQQHAGGGGHEMSFKVLVPPPTPGEERSG